MPEFLQQKQTVIHQNNIVYYPPQDNKTKVPWLFKYTSDREEQIKKFTEFFDHHFQEKNNRPLFVIVYGFEQECHDALIEYLYHDIIQNLFRNYGIQKPVKKFHISWPKASIKTVIRIKEFQNSLTSTCVSNPTGKIEEVIESFSRNQEWILFHSYLNVYYWCKNEAEVIDFWINFWEENSRIYDMSRIFVFLCIQYKNKWSIALKKMWIKKILNKRYAQFLLPELLPISEYDAKNWIRNNPRFFPNLQDAISFIDNIYYKYSTQNLPMEKLANELNHYFNPRSQE